MKFGKYYEMLVGGIMNINGGKTYLQWVYYNMSMISFHCNVLEKLRIYSDRRIEKPGKNPDMYNEIFLKKLKIRARMGIDGIVIKAKLKKKQKGNYINVMIKDRIKFSKGSMQSGNHGH